MPPRNLSRAAAALGRRGGAARSKAKTEASRRNGAKGGRPVLTVSVGAPGAQVEVHADAALVGFTAGGRPALRALTPAAARWLKRHGFTNARRELRETINPPAGWNGRCWA
jgi:hypothetical protein